MHPAQIPLTPQTDERNFPRHDPKAGPGKSGHAYPKMLTRLCTKEDREAWIERNRKIDVNTRQDYWEEKPPKVGTPIPVVATQDLVDAGFADVLGQPVVVPTAADEVLILDTLGIKAQPAPAGTVKIPIHSPIDAEDDEVDPVVQENTMLKAALAKMQAQIDRLTAAPAKAADPKSTKKRPKREKRAAAPRTVSLEQMAETGDDD